MYEAAGLRAGRPLRRGVFVSAIGTTPRPSSTPV